MNVKKFLRWISERKKRQYLFFFTSMMILVLMYIPAMKMVSLKAKYRGLITQDAVNDYQILGDIEQVTKEKNTIKLNGWMCRIGSNVIESHIIFKATENQKESILDTEIYINNTVNEKLGLDIREESGWNAKIKDSAIKENVAYEILFAVEFEENENIKKTEKVSTGKYFYNNEIYSYNPQMFVKPDIIEGELAEVLNKGEPLFYCSEHGLWLYLYEEKVCLIAKEMLVSRASELTDIPWFIYTCSENAIDYIYYERDLSEENCVKGRHEKYYYMFNEISSDYSVSYVKTGIWKNAGWICMPVISVFELE